MALPTQFELSRAYWDFAFENPDIVKPAHAAMFFFAIEHCNRLGWKEKFGLPASMLIEAIGLKSYNSVSTYFSDLVEWGFFKVHQVSKNQYSSNIISLLCPSSALSKNNKALSKATVKHTSKQVQKQVVGTGSIDKPINLLTNNQLTIEAATLNYYFESEEFKSAWTEWIAYKKKQHRFTFAGVKYEQMSIMSLWQESHKNEKEAIAMLQYAMGRGWKGWVAKDDVNFYSGGGGYKQPESTVYPKLRSAADIIAEREAKNRK